MRVRADVPITTVEPLEVPLRNRSEALVEEVLKPGERVVVYPPDTLKDGARIETKAGKSS